MTTPEEATADLLQLIEDMLDDAEEHDEDQDTYDGCGGVAGDSCCEPDDHDPWERARVLLGRETMRARWMKWRAAEKKREEEWAAKQKMEREQQEKEDAEYDAFVRASPPVFTGLYTPEGVRIYRKLALRRSGSLFVEDEAGTT